MFSLHPLERRDGVHQPVVARRIAVRFLAQFGMGEKAEYSQPVIDRHQDDALTRQFFSVVKQHGAGAVAEASAVNPHHHRKFVGRGFRRSPHVEVEAVLAALGLPRIGAQRLHAPRLELVHFAHAGPFRGRPRRMPAQIADRRRRVGNAAEYIDPGRGCGNTGNVAACRANGAVDRGCEGQNARHEYQQMLHQVPLLETGQHQSNPRRAGFLPPSARKGFRFGGTGGSAQSHLLCAGLRSVAPLVAPNGPGCKVRGRRFRLPTHFFSRPAPPRHTVRRRFPAPLCVSLSRTSHRYDPRRWAFQDLPR